MDHWLWQNGQFDKRSAWIDLILNANHMDKKFLLGNQLIYAKRGDLITSEQKLMARWGWSKNKLRSFLSLLEAEQMIVKKSDNKKTTITIVNYCKYQNKPTAEGTANEPIIVPQCSCNKTIDGATAGPPVVHKQQCITMTNNENNVNKEKKEMFVKPILKEIETYCQERHNTINPIEYHNFPHLKLLKPLKLLDGAIYVQWSHDKTAHT
jgi:DNA replication protein DnaD